MERYEAYKDSGVEWIGEIPEEWDIKRLKAVLIERKEKNNPIKTDFILSLTNTDGVIPYSEKGDRGNKAKEDLSDYFLAYPDDIVVNSMNVIIGSVGLSSYFGAVSPVYYMLRPRKEADCVRYYNYIFQSSTLQNALKGLGNGILEIRMRIPMNKLNNVMLPIPDAEQQKAIADYLDAKTTEIDALVADCEREVGLLQEYRKAVISEAVTKGLDPDAPMKDSGVEWIGEIPETWSMAKVKSCCDILPGYAFKSELFIQESDSVKLLRGINLGVNAIRWDEVVSYPLDEIEELGTYRLLAGDVVIGLDRPWIKEGLRIAIIQDEEFEQYLVQRVARLRGSSEIDVRFVKYALESGLLEYELDSLTTGVSVPHISTEQIGSTRIALPDIANQHEIVALLDNKTAEIDSLINAKQHMVDKLREYRRSLISEAVTGKFKVPGI